jgi:hypothetical protein
MGVCSQLGPPLLNIFSLVPVAPQQWGGQVGLVGGGGEGGGGGWQEGGGEVAGGGREELSSSICWLLCGRATREKEHIVPTGG